MAGRLALGAVLALPGIALAEPAAPFPSGLEVTAGVLDAARIAAGAEALERSEELNREAAAWAEAVASPGAEWPRLDDVMARLAAAGNPQVRTAVAIVQSTGPWPPPAEAWWTGDGSWERLLDPALRDLGGGAAATAEGGSVWVLLAGQARAAALASAVERLGDPKRVRAEVLDAVVAARREEGLGALRSDGRLDRAAQDYAELMAVTGHYGHRGPDGGSVADRVRRAGYRFVSVGENLAWGIESVEEVVQGWLDSPVHRKNLLDPRFRDTGLGIAWGRAEGEVPVVVWVQVFGAPARR